MVVAISLFCLLRDDMRIFWKGLFVFLRNSSEKTGAFLSIISKDVPF